MNLGPRPSRSGPFSLICKVRVLCPGRGPWASSTRWEGTVVRPSGRTTGQQEPLASVATHMASEPAALPQDRSCDRDRLMFMLIYSQMLLDKKLHV